MQTHLHHLAGKQESSKSSAHAATCVRAALCSWPVNDTTLIQLWSDLLTSPCSKSCTTQRLFHTVQRYLLCLTAATCQHTKTACWCHRPMNSHENICYGKALRSPCLCTTTLKVLCEPTSDFFFTLLFMPKLVWAGKVNCSTVTGGKDT